MCGNQGSFFTDKESELDAKFHRMGCKVKSMLVVDSAYSYADLRARHLEEFVIARDPGNYFDAILTIHPFAGVQYSTALPQNELYGRAATYKIDERNLFVEGKRGRFTWLKKCEIVNYGFSFLSVLRLVFVSNKNRKFSVVRSEDALLNGFIAWVIASLLRVPLIIGIWGNSDAIRRETKSPLMPRFFKSIRSEKRWEKFILSRAQVVLVGNEDNKKFVINNGINPLRISILPVVFNLNQLHFVEPSDRLPIDDDLLAMGIQGKDLIICISRLEPVKLVDHVLRATPFIRPHDRDFRILIVGEGSQLDELQLLCDQLAITDKVIFCGNQNQDWISRMVAKGGIVVSPLTGRALAESAMGAAAIVAYDIDWQGELIQTNLTGELVPYRDFEAMGYSISRFLKDPIYKAKMGLAVRKELISKMASIDIVSTINTIYAGLVETDKK